MRQSSIVQFLSVWAVLLFTNCLAGAAEFAGGSGEPNDPYQIATAEQLIAIGQDPNLAYKNYILVADIDLDPNLSPDYLFDRPLIDEFSGTLDGQGFCIRHLTMDVVQNSLLPVDGAGLFGRIQRWGEVRNLILEDATISAEGRGISAGAICLLNDGGRIVGCMVHATVVASSVAGGLVGSNGGFIYCCSSHGTVRSSGALAGGLIGSNRGNVEQSWSFCTTSALYECGGLIGYNDSPGKVRDCYAIGMVLGETVGGLAGGQYGIISNCYAACEIDGTGSSVGGLVGRMQFSHSETETVHCYFLSGPDNGIGTLLTGEQISNPADFVGWDFWGLGNDGFGVVWFIPEGGPPQLIWPALASIPDVRGLSLEEAVWSILDSDVGIARITYDHDPMIPLDHVSIVRPRSEMRPGALVDLVVSLGQYDWNGNLGAGTLDNPYGISSAGQLDCLAHEPMLWDKSFVFLTDLDMAWRTYSEPLIGQANSQAVAFEGTFDGRGHTIRNLTFVSLGLFGNYDTVTLGLFGRIGPAGSVYDLGLRDISVGGRRYDQAVGGMLCAINEGDISRCYSRGTMNWSGRCGGLVGRNAGIIQDCYAQGEIEADDYIGRSDSRPDGGLVGENTTGEILTCYSTCIVNSHGGGGLVGENIEGVVIDSLWDAEASGIRTNDWGIGLSTTEIMDAQVLQDIGWGGNPNWIIDDGRDYPRLIWEGTPGALIPGTM